MQTFDHQTSNDLEFDLIRLMLHDYCNCHSAQSRMVDLSPIANAKALKQELFRTNELLRTRREGYSFPNISFQELDKELDYLNTPNAVLNQESFMVIRNDSELVNDIIKFFKENNEEFPALMELLHSVFYTDKIIKKIDKIFDPKGRIKDDASKNLSKIRKEILQTRKNITRNFNQIIKKYKEKGWLADTNEAFLNERRLLSVQSTYKRQIPGTVLGSSKTGNFTYIEPKENVGLNFELEMLQDDERKEIHKILRVLSDDLREFLPLINAYNELLVELDFVQAKMKLAVELNACLPGISDESKIELIDAYHPILYLTNKKENITTHPQSLYMDKFSRMLVISGPNAGGKSITLKTVGLLQIMFQSGLLVPVDPNSKMSVFEHILSDIGDNQSIENQLSTYSYRLKRMKEFLEITNKKTLLLLDEFGTGSDPELGGALAEVFFEKLYSKKCYGVITTHYSNIKLKAAQLQNAINGCMLFNKDSLAPLFQLSIGQPGSSFTFEVAEANGIDIGILDEARSKLDQNRVRMDKMLSELQIEKGRTEALNKSFEKQRIRSEKLESEFKLKKTRLDEKLNKQQEVAEENNQFIRKGKKMEALIKKWNSKGKNKEVLDEIKKYLAVEKTKIEEELKTKRLKEQVKTKIVKKKAKKDNSDKIIVGCTVKLNDTRQRGVVLEIKGTQVLVAFGNFKTKVDKKNLMWVNY